MNILIIGDIVGNTGVNKVKEVLPNLIKSENIDFIIANAENSAEGMGITTKIFKELLNVKVNVITMGNHTWGKREIFNFIDDEKTIE